MPSREVDFLIIGQGLAGSLLAFELVQRQQTVLVVDNHNIGSSSQVAAGIINPITGHRLNLTEGFSSNFMAAKETYQKVQKSLSCKIYREIEQHRLIKNAGQADYLDKRLDDPFYQSFLEAATQSNFRDVNHGVAKVKQTALIDSKALLQSTKSWLQRSERYLSAALDYTSITFTKTGVHIDDINWPRIQAKKIIFCEGYQAINNPWLKSLPFKLSKGEILTVTNKSPINLMLSWGNWYVPQADGLAKLGSNYAWGDLSLSPSTGVKDKLLLSLRENLKVNTELMDHEVGIRPTTKHRQPFIGPISGLENAYCFNGFGSKGCLTIPQYASDLCDFILSDKALSAEVCQWL